MKSSEEIRLSGRVSAPRARRLAFAGLACLLAVASAVVRGDTLPNPIDIDVPNGTTYTVAQDQSIRMLTGSGTVSIGDTHSLTVNLPSSGDGSSSTFSGLITGNGTYTFVKDGPGYFTFLGQATSLQSQTDVLTVNVNSGIFQLGDGGTTGSINGNLLIGQAGTFIFNRSDASFALPVSLTGTGTFSKQGTGNLTLDRTAGFGGTLQVQAGTLTAAADKLLTPQASVNVSAGATFAVSDATTAGIGIGMLNGAGATTIAAGRTLTVAGQGNGTYAGTISGSGALAKTGFGSLWLEGTNTYSGGTTVSSGTLGLQLVQTIATAGNTAGANLSAPVTTWVLSHPTADLTIGDTASAHASLMIDSGAGASDRNGLIATASGSSGNVDVDGAASQWISNGDLKVGVLGIGSLSVANGASVSAGNAHIAVNSGSGGNVTIDGPGSVLNSTGALNVGESGSGSLVVRNGGTVNVANGSGTIVLGVNAGASGVLGIGSQGDDQPQGPGIVNAATITTGAGNGTVILNNSATGENPFYLTKDGTATGAAVTVTGATQLTNRAGYNVVLGSQTYTGPTNLWGGTLVVGAANALPTGTTLNFSDTYDYSPVLVLGYNQTVAAITDTSYAGDTGTTLGLASGTTLTVANPSGFQSLFAGTITDLTANSAGGKLVLANVGNGKTPTTLILTGNNTYTGGTVLGSGTTLQLGNGGWTGSIVGNVSNNGRLIFDQNGSSTFGGAISGSGAVVLGLTNRFSSGLLTLTGQNTYTGSTVINSGTLVVGADNTLPTATTLVFNPAGYGGTFNVANNQTIAAISNNGQKTGNRIAIAAGKTLTLAGSGRSSSFSGYIYGDGGIEVAAGSLTLTGLNVFGGGLKIDQGSSVYLGYNIYNTSLANTTDGETGPSIYGPAGSGTIEVDGGTLGNAGTFAIANRVILGDGSTLATSYSSNGDLAMTFNGVVTAAAPSTRVHVATDGPVVFAGGLAGANANTTITFDSGNRGFGGAIVAGTTDASVSRLVADHSALLFGSADALPATVAIGAVNEGYVGIVQLNSESLSALSTNPATPALLLSRIDRPAAFAGTLGFDSDPQSSTTSTYTDDLDFSAFTNASFSIGSATKAILAGHITAPNDGTTGLYHFGGGPGVLVIASGLTDTPLAAGSTTLLPTSVLVSSPGDLEPQSVVFQGDNTYTGNLAVDHSAAVLDAATALPKGATVTLGANSYLGYTSEAGFASFADFAGRIAPGGYTATSILGLDSHEWIGVSLQNGEADRSYYQWNFTDPIDLSRFNSIYFGTGTTLAVSGPIVAPADRVLRLAALGDASLLIDSQLSSQNGLDAVALGLPTSQSGAANMDFGTVLLAGDNTYAGGTTLYSGTLAINRSSTSDSNGHVTSGPIGTGALTVAAGSSDKLPVLRTANTDPSAALQLGNDLVLAGSLQIGTADGTTNNTNIPIGGPLVLLGAIGGSGGLVVESDTILANSANSYGGGTYVDHNGRLLFAAPGSLPASGAITAASFNSYVGIDFGLSSVQTTFLNRFNKSATAGTIGLDSFQSGGTQTYTGNLDLTGFGPTARLGSATSAIVGSGATITPSGSTGAAYQFGGGGGWLQVDAALTNAGSINRGLNLNSPSDDPLTLRLTNGANTFTGQITVTDSALIFAANAWPAATNNLSINSAGYVGTEDPNLPFATFLGHLSYAGSDAVIGFDTAPNARTPRIVDSVVDLSQFNNGAYVYLGSATSIVFGANASFLLPFTNSGYRFAGYKGGQVQIDTALTGQGYALTIGNPSVLATQENPNSNGQALSTVTLNGTNTYTGTTYFYAGRLLIGNDQALGTGTLEIESNDFEWNNQGLDRTHVPVLASAGGLHTLANPIDVYGNLTISGDLNLAGALNGWGDLYKIDSNTLTISGHNGNFYGDIYVSNGNVTFTQDDSAGTGELGLGGPLGPSVTFASSAPTIGTLSGDNAADRIALADNATLTIRQGNYTRFNGTIAGNNAQVVLDAASSYDHLTLNGANTYSGGTTIKNGTLVVGASDALPTTGTVTLNGGTLATDVGVTVNFGGNGRPLVVSRGTIAGYGTFAMASSLYIGGSANGSTVLMPGDSSSPSTLNFTFTEGTKLVLDSGGTYFWQVMDAKTWYGSVNVAGTVEIAATSATPFEIVLNAGGGSGPNGKNVSALSSNTLLTSFDLHSQYSWRILTADAIAGFDPGKFTIQLDNSFGDGIGSFNFSLALGDNGTSLLLNFDPAAVPEPSTWVLLLTGLGVVGFAAWRRRRA